MKFPMNGDGIEQGVTADAVYAELVARAKALGLDDVAEGMSVVEMRVCGGGTDGTPGYTQVQVLMPGETLAQPSYCGGITSKYPYQTKQPALQEGTDRLFALKDAHAPQLAKGV